MMDITKLTLTKQIVQKTYVEFHLKVEWDNKIYEEKPVTSQDFGSRGLSVAKAKKIQIQKIFTKEKKHKLIQILKYLRDKKTLCIQNLTPVCYTTCDSHPPEIHNLSLIFDQFNYVNFFNNYTYLIIINIYSKSEESTIFTEKDLECEQQEDLEEVEKNQ